MREGVVAGGRAAKQTKQEIGNLTWCIGTLLLLYLVGGGVFSWLERNAELERYQKNKFLYQQMKGMYELEQCKQPEFQDADMCQRQREFNDVLKAFFERTGNQMEDHSKWTFFGAIFYVSTLVTTLGYGNLHPTTAAGQLFTVLFGIIGIPLMGYVLSHAGAFIVEVCLPMFPELETRTRRFVALGSLFICFILIGGAMYRAMEEWPWVASFYFSACTLMSVGFGDFLPSHAVSRLMTMVFIMLGLGVAAAFIALLQLHVEVQSESFAKHLGHWYSSVVTEGCGAGSIEAPPTPSSYGKREGGAADDLASEADPTAGPSH